MNGVLAGVIRGMGRQGIGTIANLGSFYVVGIPMAILLTFVFDWKAFGLWTGVSLGCTVQVILLFVITTHTDFHHVVATRIGKDRTSESEPLLA